VYWSIACRWRISVIAVAVGTGLVPLVVSLFQIQYYGSGVPNTAILKESTGLASWKMGGQYIWSVLTAPVHLAAVVGTILWLRNRLGADQKGRSQAMLIVAFTALWTLYVLHVGGDAFTDARFFVPLLPLLLSLSSIALYELLKSPSQPWTKMGTKFGVALVYTTVIWNFAHLYYVGVPARKQVNREQLRIVKGLEMSGLPRETSIGVFAAGTVPYFLPELRFHDFLGKSDAHIARTRPRNANPGHNKWDYEYSLGSVKPDLIITTYPLPRHEVPRNGRGFNLTSDYYGDLWHSRLFQEHYASGRVCFKVFGERPQIYEVYVRNNSHVAARLPGCAGSES